MSQRTLLIISGALTAFVLVVAGAVAAFVIRPAEAATAPSSAVVTQPLSESTPVDVYAAASVQTLLDQQDAAYRDALQTANDRLTQANAQLDQAYKDRASLEQALKEARNTPTAQAAAPQPSAPEPTAAPVQNKEPSYAVSPQSAAAVAVNSAPGSSLMSTPSLVNFQGTVAYEVLLDTGPVYVNANTGAVLYNGAASPVYSTQQTSGGHEGGEDNEHEGEGGDD
jgi:uncharacterized membrane protein YkoI